MKQNPLKRASANIGCATTQLTPSVRAVALFDTRSPVLTTADLIGFLTLDEKNVADTSVAASGYGPLLYHCAAQFHGTIRPSADQSPAAKRFWGRIGKRLLPLPDLLFEELFELPFWRLERAGKRAIPEATWWEWEKIHGAILAKRMDETPPPLPFEVRFGRG